MSSIGTHTIQVAALDGGDSADNHQEVAASLSATTVTFSVDGVPISFGRTAIKRFLNPELLDAEFAWWLNFGVLLPPGSLSVGPHELVTTIDFHDGEGPELIETPFTVDGAGTGACL